MQIFCFRSLQRINEEEFDKDRGLVLTLNGLLPSTSEGYTSPV